MMIQILKRVSKSQKKKELALNKQRYKLFLKCYSKSMNLSKK